MDKTRTSGPPDALLARRLEKTPGMQYIVVDRERVLFEFAGGWADILNRTPMGLSTTLMAYSMTKTFTATAILQLAGQGKLHLDDSIKVSLPDCPYPEEITVRHLLSHSSGIPNPIPLRWVHLAKAHPSFDERAALTGVMQKNARLSFKPGTKYLYSNVGYWLLGFIIEAVTSQTYTDYMLDRIIQPLGLQAVEMGFVISDPTRHAKGYLRTLSLLNLVKGLITDREVWGQAEEGWLAVHNHYVNGPAFGGLVGNVRAIGCFLQDQLQERSVLLDPEAKYLFYSEQKDDRGRSLGMTLGWHIGHQDGARYYYKEGGGGGFHCEMRLYPERQIGSVVMVNSTEFDTKEVMGKIDREA